MVDCAVVLEPNDVDDEEKVKNIIRDMDTNSQTVNQTKSPRLHFHPSDLSLKQSFLTPAVPSQKFSCYRGECWSLQVTADPRR